MIDRMRKWLSYYYKNKYVRDYMDFSNMRSAIYMSCVVIILECWMLVMLFVTLSLSIRIKPMYWIVGHIISYFVLLTVSIIVLIYSIRGLKRHQNNHTHSAIIFTLFAVVSIIFGIYISYFDYANGGQIFVFCSLTMFSLCLLVWPPIWSLVLSVPAFIFMYRIMVLIDGASHSNKINFIVMWICVILSASANYSHRVREALKDENLERTNSELIQLSQHDELTGMKNRSGMIADLPLIYGKQVIVMMTDIDSFKYINDTYGHETGDVVLRRMAQHFHEIFPDSLQEITQTTERFVRCYRFGGDEFIIFACNYVLDEFLEKIKTWQHDLSVINFENTSVKLLCSCGYVYGTPEDHTDATNMIRFADLKLYEAKHQGRMQISGETAKGVENREQSRPSGRRMLTEAETDPLTGLPNILYFREHADKLLNDLSADIPVTFLYMDIQNFKNYNEKYGFQGGDSLLRLFAEKLDTLFAGELPARASDDHFMVLLGSRDYESKLEELSNYLHTLQRDIPLQLKIGIYLPESTKDCDASLSCDKARIACKSIKKLFDVHTKIYDNDLENVFRRKQYIINNLDSAIEHGNIIVYYQPIVSLNNGKVCSWEALARWKDPNYGMISPGEFIPVLEEYHQIHKLDLCIIRQVCRDFRELTSDHLSAAKPVSINFSRLDFELCDIVGEFQKIVEDAHIPPYLLDVEITETALMGHPEYLANAMKQLHKAGFKIWLDDFGSGYSSLNVLKDYEFDVLKIDMKFLSNFAGNTKSKIILSNIIQLSKMLSIIPLCEGVEDPDQIAFLKETGCERAQGYYYGKPQDFETSRQLVLDGKLLLTEN